MEGNKIHGKKTATEKRAMENWGTGKNGQWEKWAMEKCIMGKKATVDKWQRKI